ncbi:MAG: hypothetical protein AAF928_12180 [Myxococcota bacterium]
MGCNPCAASPPPPPTYAEPAPPAAVAEALLEDGRAAASPAGEPAPREDEAGPACAATYATIQTFRRRVGVNPLAIDGPGFVALCEQLPPATRRCLDPAHASREAASCIARVEALPSAQRQRVRAAMRGASTALGSPP